MRAHNLKNTNQRILLHKEAMAYFHKANYEKAEEQLLSIIYNYGEHIGVLCDLSACYYYNQKYDLYEESIKKIKETIRLSQMFTVNKNTVELSSHIKITA